MKTTVFNQRNIMSGIIGGLIAGIALGFVLMRMGTLASAGSMLAMQDELSSFLIHLIFSAIAGLIFALVFCKICTSFYNTTLWGIVYGILWWFLGPLILCPWIAGATITWSQTTFMQAIPMLLGHLIYGLVLGITYFWFRERK
jgi:uncharacterized membrane protein YagU involved in acid resistance